MYVYMMFTAPEMYVFALNGEWKKNKLSTEPNNNMCDYGEPIRATDAANKRDNFSFQ